MIRFQGIKLLLLWLFVLLSGLFLYFSSLVLYCNGQNLGFIIDIILSTIFILESIDNVNQIPSYFYQIIHNRYEHEDEIAHILIYNEKK